MISSITGTLTEVAPLRAVVEAGGIGYEVHVPITTTERLPPVGATVHLFTLAVYREDDATLFGFHNREERDFFRLLVEKVSGVGPRIALSILSRLSIPVLRGAIANGDVGLLAKCRGIGKKTAERLVVELRDRVGAAPAAPPAPAAVGATPGSGSGAECAPAGDTRAQDAFAALLTLGYKPAEADKAIRRATGQIPPEASTEELIKQALR